MTAHMTVRTIETVGNVPTRTSEVVDVVTPGVPFAIACFSSLQYTEGKHRSGTVGFAALSQIGASALAVPQTVRCIGRDSGYTFNGEFLGMVSQESMVDAQENVYGIRPWSIIHHAFDADRVTFTVESFPNQMADVGAGALGQHHVVIWSNPDEVDALSGAALMWHPAVEQARPHSVILPWSPGAAFMATGGMAADITVVPGQDFGVENVIPVPEPFQPVTGPGQNQPVVLREGRGSYNNPLNNDFSASPGTDPGVGASCHPFLQMTVSSGNTYGVSNEYGNGQPPAVLSFALRDISAKEKLASASSAQSVAFPDARPIGAWAQYLAGVTDESIPYPYSARTRAVELDPNVSGTDGTDRTLNTDEGNLRVTSYSNASASFIDTISRSTEMVVFSDATAPVNEAPSVTLISPPDGSLFEPEDDGTTAVQLQWDAVDPEGDSILASVVSYGPVVLGETVFSGATATVLGGEQTTIQVPGEGEFGWRVRASDNQATAGSGPNAVGEWSDEWRFSIRATPVVVLDPGAGAYPADQTITINWDVVRGTQANFEVYYELVAAADGSTVAGGWTPAAGWLPSSQEFWTFYADYFEPGQYRVKVGVRDAASGYLEGESNEITFTVYEIPDPPPTNYGLVVTDPPEPQNVNQPLRIDWELYGAPGAQVWWELWGRFLQAQGAIGLPNTGLHPTLLANALSTAQRSHLFPADYFAAGQWEFFTRVNTTEAGVLESLPVEATLYEVPDPPPPPPGPDTGITFVHPQPPTPADEPVTLTWDVIFNGDPNVVVWRWQVFGRKVYDETTGQATPEAPVTWVTPQYQSNSRSLTVPANTFAPGVWEFRVEAITDYPRANVDGPYTALTFQSDPPPPPSGPASTYVHPIEPQPAADPLTVDWDFIWDGDSAATIAQYQLDWQIVYDETTGQTRDPSQVNTSDWTQGPYAANSRSRSFPGGQYDPGVWRVKVTCWPAAEPGTPVVSEWREAVLYGDPPPIGDPPPAPSAGARQHGSNTYIHGDLEVEGTTT